MWSTFHYWFGFLFDRAFIRLLCYSWPLGQNGNSAFRLYITNKLNTYTFINSQASQRELFFKELYSTSHGLPCPHYIKQKSCLSQHPQHEFPMGPWDDWWEWIWPPPSLWTFLMERKTWTIALARGGKCNLPSSIGTFLLNSLSRFLCPWELRLALQSESKVLFPQSFELDACSRIDFCLAQSFLHGRNKRKSNNNILLRSWSCLQISESRNCCFTTSQMWCVMKSCLEKNRSTNSSTWSAEPGERRLPVGKTFQTKSNISC